MEEEVEVFELEEMKKDQSNTQIMSSLTQKLKEGFKVSIMVRKLFRLPVATSKKNNFFSKQAIHTNKYEPDFSNESMNSQDSQIKIMPLVLDQEFKLIDNTASSMTSRRQTSPLQINLDSPHHRRSSSNNAHTTPVNNTPVNKFPCKTTVNKTQVSKTPDARTPVNNQVTSVRHVSVQVNVQEEESTSPGKKSNDMSPTKEENLLPRLKFFGGNSDSIKQIVTCNIIDDDDDKISPREIISRSNSQKFIFLVKPVKDKTQPSLPPESPVSSNSSRVDFFMIKDETFWLKLKTFTQYQKVQSALLYLQDGDFKAAYELISIAYQESEAELKKENEKINTKLYSLIAIQALCYQAQILKCLGKFDEANKQYMLFKLRSLERCLKNFEINDFDILGKIYLECGNNSVHQLKLLKGLDYYTKALCAYEKVNWKLDIAKVLTAMAHLYALLGAFEDATKMCFESLAIFKQRLSDFDVRIADVHHTLGFIFYLQKDYEASMEYLKQSLLQKQKMFGEKHISLVKTYNLMGVVQHLADEPHNAIEYYEQAVWIYGGESQLGLAQVLNNLGMAYIDRMKVKSAKLSFEKSIQIYQEYYNEEDPSIRRTIQNKNLALLQFGKSNISN